MLKHKDFPVTDEHEAAEEAQIYRNIARSRLPQIAAHPAVLPC